MIYHLVSQIYVGYHKNYMLIIEVWENGFMRHKCVIHNYNPIEQDVKKGGKELNAVYV